MAWGLWFGCALGLSYAATEAWAPWLFLGGGAIVATISALTWVAAAHQQQHGPVPGDDAVAQSAGRALRVAIFITAAMLGLHRAHAECRTWAASIGQLPDTGILTDAVIALGEPRANRSPWKVGDPFLSGELVSAAGHPIGRRVDVEFELATRDGDEPGRARALASLPQPGDTIHTLAWWKPPRAPPSFDTPGLGVANTPQPIAPAARYTRGGGGTLVVPCDGWGHASPAGPLDWLKAVRCRARAQTGRALRESILPWPDVESRSILACMVIGTEREGAKPALADFAVTGLTHLVAISGFNVAILAGGLLWLGRWFRLRHRGRSILLLTGAILFALAVQPDISATRAAFMAIVAGVAALLGAHFTPRAVLGWVAVALMLDDPHAALRPGFQMSFVAVIALLDAQRVDARLLSDRWMHRSLPHLVLAGATLALLLSLRVWLATLPSVWCHFGLLAFWGPLLTVLVSPIAAAAIVLGSLATATSLLLTFAGTCFAMPAAALAWLLVQAAHLGAAAPGAAVLLQLPPTLTWLAGPLSLALTMAFLWVARQPVGGLVRRPVNRGWLLVASLAAAVVASIRRPSRNSRRSPSGPSTPSRHSIVNGPRVNVASRRMPRRGSAPPAAPAPVAATLPRTPPLRAPTPTRSTSAMTAPL
ncbi:MAG: ComEC/Rec2 family competence protein [Planctomycetota bacterium]|nr:ComEC/Rec2 family competence protein [Planctomycetota bacterium]